MPTSAAVVSRPRGNPRDSLEPQWQNLVHRAEPVSTHLRMLVEVDSNVRERAKHLEEALQYLQKQVAMARAAALFRGQDPQRFGEIDADYAPKRDEASPSSLLAVWERITNDALVLAWHGHMLLKDLRRKPRPDEAPAARDKHLKEPSHAGEIDLLGNEAQIAHRSDVDQRTSALVRQREAARITVYALREAVFARLCYLRAEINRGIVNSEMGIPPLGDTLDQVRRLNTAFDRQIQRWRLRRYLRGELESGNATAYKVWSQQLGSALEGEPNWGMFIRPVNVELRYRNHLMELRQRWHEIPPTANDGHFLRSVALTPLRLLHALSLQVFRVVAGLGLRPMRFAVTTILTIAIFSLAYGLDDWLTSAKHTLEPPGRYLYYAVVYLTSVGADHTPQGLAAPTLIAIESIFGYFLLSALAAMFFLWLTER